MFEISDLYVIWCILKTHRDFGGNRPKRSVRVLVLHQIISFAVSTFEIIR